MGQNPHARWRQTADSRDQARPQTLPLIVSWPNLHFPGEIASGNITNIPQNVSEHEGVSHGFLGKDANGVEDSRGAYTRCTQQAGGRG